MSSGVLGRADLTANVDTVVYTVPAGKLATVNVNVCNRGSSTNIRLALSATGTPSNADYVEYDTELRLNSVLERTGLVIEEGTRVIARSGDNSTVSVVIIGMED